MENKTIYLKGFNLPLFRNLLNQSLSTNKTLMLEWNNDFIRACSISASFSFMKLWNIPKVKLLTQKSDEKIAEEQIAEIFDKSEIELPDQEIPTFNFYVLKGDSFAKYISVHNNESVDLEFTLTETANNKYQATTITIIGSSESNAPLKTTFNLTVEDIITSKIDDYNAIIKEMTPKQNDVSITLVSENIQEIKRLLKKLNQANSDNVSYLTFTVTNKSVVVNDMVFTIEFDLQNQLLNTDDVITFNILKKDIIMLGNHNFIIYTNNDSQKVIFIAQYGGSVISCLCTKAQKGITEMDDDELQSSIEGCSSEDLNEYFPDDLPF